MPWNAYKELQNNTPVIIRESCILLAGGKLSIWNIQHHIKPQQAAL